MNTRRDLLFMLGAGALLSARTSLAQQQSKKTHQIGFLTRKKDASVLTQIEAFRQQLHDLGWIEGNNVNIAYRDADGELNRLDSLALELVNLNVDVIVTVDTPPTQAAIQRRRKCRYVLILFSYLNSLVLSCPMALTFQIYFAGPPFSWTRY